MAFPNSVSSSLLSSASRDFKQFSASSKEAALREVGNGKFATWMREAKLMSKQIPQPKKQNRK